MVMPSRNVQTASQRALDQLGGAAGLGVVVLCFVMTSTGALAAATVSKESTQPGTLVQRAGETVNLYPGTLKVGDDFKPLAKGLGLELKGTAVVSIVPSIDTQVCEEQSHIMSESPDLKANIQRVIVSRDTPMAQKRFVREAKLGNLVLASDFTQGSFGKQTGLLMKGPELLARAVLVVDSRGVIRHLQVVKDVTNMPDMKAAFELANSLDAKP